MLGFFYNGLASYTRGIATPTVSPHTKKPVLSVAKESHHREYLFISLKAFSLHHVQLVQLLIGKRRIHRYISDTHNDEGLRDKPITDIFLRV